MGWNYLSIPKLQWLHRWSLGMDKLFHPIHYNGCNYLCMLGLKLNHVSKRSPRQQATSGTNVVSYDSMPSAGLSELIIDIFSLSVFISLWLIMAIICVMKISACIYENQQLLAMLRFENRAYHNYKRMCPYFYCFQCSWIDFYKKSPYFLLVFLITI